MWHVLTCCDKYYLFKVIEHGNDLMMTLTDFESMWCNRIGKEEFVTIFQDENPLYSDDDEDVFSVAFKLLLDLKAVFQMDTTEASASIKWKSYIGDLPMRLTITFSKQVNPNFRTEITVPMIQSIQYLEWKQKKLEYLLQMKDKELMEYKYEYGNITRKMVETLKYEPDHTTKEDLLLNIFSTNEAFLKMFSEQHCDIRNIYADIKQDDVQNPSMQLAPSMKKRKY